MELEEKAGCNLRKLRRSEARSTLYCLRKLQEIGVPPQVRLIFKLYLAF